MSLRHHIQTLEVTEHWALESHTLLLAASTHKEVQQFYSG